MMSSAKERLIRKLQTPNTKLQRSTNYQAPRTEPRAVAADPTSVAGGQMTAPCQTTGSRREWAARPAKLLRRVDVRRL
jgi:hypothetical protein